MNSFSWKTIIFSIAALALIFMVNGNDKIKREYPNLNPLSDFTSELADDDLEAGLRSLSSSELRTLSEFIDEESKSLESNAYQNAMNKYWKGRIGSEALKKKRTIDDLYDEMAHENAELDFNREYHSSPSKTVPNDGKCHCEKNPQKDDAIRAKRNSLRANEKEEQNMNEYVQQLKESFPRDQSASINGGEIDVPNSEHIRIKRL